MIFDALRHFIAIATFLVAASVSPAAADYGGLDVDFLPARVGADTPSQDAIEISASYTYDVFHSVAGGFGAATGGMGLLDLALEADLGELFEFGKTIFVVSAFAGQGGDFSASSVGDFGVVSNIYHANEFNLFNIYLHCEIGEGGSFIKLGQIAADEDFMGSETAGLFINSSFGPFNTQSGNTGTPIFPFAAPGMVFHYSLEESWHVILGVYAGLADDGEGENFGFNWRWGGSAGQAVFVESGVLYNKAGGALKVGGYFHSGEFENFADGGFSEGIGMIYGIVDHALGSRVNAFFRGSRVLGGESVVVTSTIDGGITVSDTFYEGDTLGIGLSHAVFGDDYIRARRGGTGTETILEFTYRLPINEHFVIQPDFQYLFDPHESGRDGLLLGLRASIAF